jgi:hypothetical protein
VCSVKSGPEGGTLRLWFSPGLDPHPLEDLQKVPSFQLLAKNLE